MDGCTTRSLTKRLEKKPYGNHTSMLRAILNKHRKQHTTKQLDVYLPPISQAIQIRQEGHAGRCWRNKDELISNVHQWTPIHRHTTVGWPAKSYIHQLFADTGCRLENIPKPITEREMVRDSQRNPYSKHALMMMMMMIKPVFYKFLLTDLGGLV